MNINNEDPTPRDLAKAFYRTVDKYYKNIVAERIKNITPEKELEEAPEKKTKKLYNRPDETLKKCFCKFIIQHMEKNLTAKDCLSYSESLSESDIYRIYSYSRKEINKYYKRDHKKAENLCKCVENLLYCKVKTERKIIIYIAFAFEFSADDCNSLLQAGEFQKLHYGGDYIEATIYYCLKHKYSYYDCKEILVQYREYASGNKNSVFFIAPEKSFSQRSEFFEKEADGAIIKSKEDIIKKVMLLSKNSTPYNNRLHRYLRNTLGVKKEITARTFANFFDNITEHDYNTLRVSFSEFTKEDIASKPSRAFICLTCIFLYYKNYKNYSEKYGTLIEFTDIKLDEYGYDTIIDITKNIEKNHDLERVLDSFVIELSKYTIIEDDSSQKTTSEVYYNGVRVFINGNAPDFPSPKLFKNNNHLAIMKYIMNHYYCNVVEKPTRQESKIKVRDISVDDKLASICKMYYLSGVSLQDKGSILEDF